MLSGPPKALVDLDDPVTGFKTVPRLIYNVMQLLQIDHLMGAVCQKHYDIAVLYLSRAEINTGIFKSKRGGQ